MNDRLFGEGLNAPQPAKRNLCYEALANATGTDWNQGRGQLNKALKDIRAQTPGLNETQLAQEIRVRAGMYRSVMPTALLTPPALAKHWKRVKEVTRPQKRVVKDCARCNNDRVIPVITRDDGYEAYAPCPDCGPRL